MQAETLFQMKPISCDMRWEFVLSQGKKYICIWREMMEDDVLFFRHLTLINQFYQSILRNESLPLLNIS